MIRRDPRYNRFDIAGFTRPTSYELAHKRDDVLRNLIGRAITRLARLR